MTDRNAIILLAGATLAVEASAEPIYHPKGEATLEAMRHHCGDLVLAFDDVPRPLTEEITLKFNGPLTGETLAGDGKRNQRITPTATIPQHRHNRENTRRLKQLAKIRSK